MLSFKGTETHMLVLTFIFPITAKIWILRLWLQNISSLSSSIPSPSPPPKKKSKNVRAAEAGFTALLGTAVPCAWQPTQNTVIIWSGSFPVSSY